MFKKRTRPASVREKISAEKVESGILASGSNSDLEDEESNIDELILLRKLRRSQPGIDLEKFNRGEERRKGKKRDIDGAAEKFGIQTQRAKEGDKDDEIEDENERAKRLVRSNNFTQQTNALDVDKHMLAYIESELQKRRGQGATEGIGGDEVYDPQAELYKIAERYKFEQRKKGEDEEGNVTNSLGMLTSIPEVDLGMDNRLRNIEMTEKAKRDMLEARKATVVKKRPEDEDFAAARFFRPALRVASDIYVIEDAKREAAGLPPTSKPPRTDVPRHENATDEQVYERFKKRMKR
ncbi:MAG: hypothetical protein TREMPRED_000131 [Tremellales sp. Tagirdzhanova-0007]|nr:MAG: hypothetical protein TREMPRED_000131 [Tremellales sp. Tagirdzhanova-0007]